MQPPLSSPEHAKRQCTAPIKATGTEPKLRRKRQTEPATIVLARVSTTEIEVLVRLSVLDQSPVAQGSSASQALARTRELAQLADRLGYERYWVAEHHGSESFAGSSPEVLISHLAACTQRIRVGSAGVMLMHYSPLKVAENFKLLENLYPDRIDLGIGRAPGSDGITAAALAYGNQIGIEYFPAKVADLKAFLRDETPHTPALKDVKATPRSAETPQMWMLGSSRDGAELAARFGLPYSHAHFIAPEQAIPAIEHYRSRFTPSAFAEAPQVNLGIFVICSDDAERARALGRCRDLWRLRVERGEFGPYPSVEEAASVTLTPQEQARIDARSEHQLLGTPAEVVPAIRDLADRCGADELSVISICHDHNDRVRCYELLAEHLLTASGAS